MTLNLLTFIGKDFECRPFTCNGLTLLYWYFYIWVLPPLVGELHMHHQSGFLVFLWQHKPPCCVSHRWRNMIEMEIFHFSVARVKRDSSSSHAVCLISTFSAFRYNAQLKCSQMLTVCFHEIFTPLTSPRTLLYVPAPLAEKCIWHNRGKAKDRET